MLKVLLLVCAMTVSQTDCQEATARTVVEGPDARNPMACAMRSQAYFASTALEIGEDEYLKIKCVRTAIAKANVG